MFQTILVQPLFNLLLVIYAYLPGHDFGVAIILFTVLVRLVLWPLVNRQLHSQRAMQKLAPEVARIKKESAGDRQLESKLLMELYKERGVSPFGSLLPLLIQLPIFLALYIVLRDMVKPHEVAQLAYPAVKHIPYVAHLLVHGGAIDPTFLGVINLAKPAVVLAVTAALAQFIQAKQLAPKTPPTDTQAKAVQSMTFVFPVITFLVALSLPAALALYWTATSLMAVFQQWLVLRHDVEEMEEAVVLPPKQINAPAKKKPQAKRKPKSKRAS